MLDVDVCIKLDEEGRVVGHHISVCEEPVCPGLMDDTSPVGVSSPVEGEVNWTGDSGVLVLLGEAL